MSAILDEKQTLEEQQLPGLEALPYPSQPAMKYLYKTPLLLWRLGFGPLLGRLFLILTTTGRKSGLPRHTVVEYRTWLGRKHALAAWPQSDWYRNLLADPRATIQTAEGSESVIARRLTSDEELSEIFQFLAQDPIMQRYWQLLGLEMTLDNFLANKDQFYVLAFDPSDAATPVPLQADLAWLWPVVLLAVLLLRLRSRPAS